MTKKEAVQSILPNEITKNLNQVKLSFKIPSSEGIDINAQVISDSIFKNFKDECKKNLRIFENAKMTLK